MSKVNLKNKELVTVVIATFNGEEYLEQQIISIVSQSRLPDEIIFVDDCSQDNTIEIINKLIETFPKTIIVKKIFRKKNVGYIKNFIDGIFQATGDLVFTCDQDDVWLPNKIAMNLDFFQEKKDCLALHSNTILIDKDNNLIKENAQEYQTEKKIKLAEFIKKVNYPGMALAFRRDKIIQILESYGLLTLNLPTHDWTICLAAVLGEGFYITDKVYTMRRYTGVNVALNIKENRLVDIRDRIEGIKQYIVYYNFLIEIREINRSENIIDGNKYLNTALYRMRYLEEISLLMAAKNVKALKYYPSLKSYIGDIILILKSKFYT
jgi:glycosyltransferase involved in cell wall biosynthesis